MLYIVQNSKDPQGWYGRKNLTLRTNFFTKNIFRTKHMYILYFDKRSLELMQIFPFLDDVWNRIFFFMMASQLDVSYLYLS